MLLLCTMGSSSKRKRERRQVLAHLETAPKASTSVIAKRIRKCNSFVGRWRKRIEQGDESLEDDPRSGRPTKLSKEEIARGRRHLEQTRHATIASATALLNDARSHDQQVSSRTVRRHVVKGSGLQYSEPFREKVSHANARKREAATTKIAIQEVRRKLNQLVFIDAAFVRWRKGHPIKAFRREKQWTSKCRPQKQDLAGAKLYQFYAAITKGPDGQLYRHPLIFVPAGQGLNAKCFVNQVAKPVHEWARSLFCNPAFEYVLDNASCHTAESTEEWMELNDFTLHAHPPQSPDLNRIEKAWAYLKCCVNKKCPRTERGFYHAMQDAWMHLDSSVLSRFIDELPQVMEEVHKKPKRQVQK